MEISRLLVVVAIYLVFRYFIRNRSPGSESPAMSHGKVTPIDNPVIFKALTSSGPVVVDFFATWCGPCKAVAPVLGKLSETYTDVKFLQVDVDKARSISQEHQVRAMPTFVLYKDGKLLEKRIVGGNMKELEEEIKSMLA